MVAVGVVGAVCLMAAPGTASAQPANPADARISAAQQAKDAAAQQVGAITAQLAKAQAGAAAAGQAAQIALQDYQEKEAAYSAAQHAAGRAATAAATAVAGERAGRAQVAAFARSSYVDGTTNPGIVALMTAGGPAQLLERAALLDAAGAHRADVVRQLIVLRGKADKANQAARRTVGQADTLKAQAGSALNSAISQEVSARAQTAALAVQQKDLQAQLQQAQQTLSGLAGARVAAQIYAAQQAAAQQAAAQSAGKQRSPVVSHAPPPTPTPSSNGDGSSAGGGAPGGSSPGGSSSGGGAGTGAPSGSAVQIAIAAAKHQLGVPYAWGGGGPRGPSMGFGPDAGVVGFDCSGLTQYAYARAGISISRVARDQYADFSDRSVASSDLQPGDLVFWANGNSYASIYHVALYIGGGNVIAAPQSGDVVKIESMWFGSDYFGAVRPTA
jgi:cell wall-associated NlpC family hydrolase